MEMNKLDKSVLKLWYIHALIIGLALLGGMGGIMAVLYAAEASGKAMLAVLLAVGIPVLLLLGFIMLMPALRYRVYEWGYDDTRITVKQGVIFRQRAVIPVCQIQDLHRNQGPIMMMLGLSGVTISTAGSNFDISTLTTGEADRLIDALEQALEARIEELKNETV